ncbi:mas-related G-protein coupled receptor member H-like [Notechis scutatus]|uniref:Mas-related G-protein coupled receptor member H-like n=1 Tax=Notechis scutatus TaxID=8663 RepID=A0A6J1W737_9SAUR|nr:mas-related G-protein coupled receptor member H-like [Notechis scutatus]XP_026548204.1 mas-related G-protein coupled receptor member H-like [Notechis scutatus]
MNATAEDLDSNTTDVFNKYQTMSNYSGSIFFFIICCIGVLLNGIVIWLLGFQIKRNAFTVLILNLAIADFGCLVFLAIFCIYHFIHFMSTGIPFLIIYCLLRIMYTNGLFILTGISIDRFVAVLFPIWHRCSRPKHLSPAVCAFLWICSFPLGGISNVMEYAFYYYNFSDLYLVFTSILCLPLITISTLILLVKICLKPKQIKRGQLLVMILITFLCFLILTLPVHIHVFIIRFIYLLHWEQFPGLGNYLNLGASLNSSINPVIYFLVGRKKRAQSRESIKVIFQRVFREDEAPENTEKATNRITTPL